MLLSHSWNLNEVTNRQDCTEYEPLKEDFDRDGYAVIRSFLAGEELEVLLQAIERYRSEVLPMAMPGTHEKPGDEETLKSMSNMDYYNPCFEDYLLKNRRIERLAWGLLDQPVIIRNVQWFNNSGIPSKRSP